MSAYYNEIDPFAAAWLRELIKAGQIAPGVVDERNIEDVTPNDLIGFTQCHFFAGIGVWSHALRTAGWPDDRPVWTGSCPCQPFSSAGKGAGFADERHLWPHFHWLISQCRPAIVLGEQVASKDGLSWLDLVQTDLEGSGYTSGAVDTCAAGFGAPHIRQRLFWVAHTDDTRPQGHRRHVEQYDPQGRKEQDGHGSEASVYGGLADTNCERHSQLQRIGDTELGGRQNDERSRAGFKSGISINRSSPTNGYWRDADWLFCRDGKWRPVESGTSPLAHGPAARVGRLRGYGNAIVAPQATAFIEAVMESLKGGDA